MENNDIRDLFISNNKSTIIMVYRITGPEIYDQNVKHTSLSTITSCGRLPVSWDLNYYDKSVSKSMFVDKDS